MPYASSMASQLIAGFSTNDSIGCAPLTLHFNNNSSGGATYYWDFDDGLSSTLFDPIHIFYGQGTYKVTLYAYDSLLNMDSATMTIHVPENKPYFTAPNEACPGKMVQCAVFGNTNPGNSVNWDFGDGYITGTSFAEHAYSDTGIYTITMTVNNPNCGIIKDSNQIIISNAIVPTVHIHPENADSIICPGENFPYFYDEYLPIIWDFGNGITSSDPYPLFSFPNEGIFPVSISVSNECGNSNTLDINILVNDSAAPDASIFSTVSSCCPSQPLTFYGGSGSNNNYLWDFGDGTIDSSMDVVHSYNDTGEYEVTLTLANRCGNEDTASTLITVTDSIIPYGWLYMEAYEGCPGTQILFIASSGFPEYLWTFGDGDTSQEQTISHVFADTGIYPIELTITNECGNTINYFDTVHIHNSYFSNTNFFLPQTTYCVGDIIYLSSTSDNPAFSYFWEMGDGTTFDSSNIQYSYLDTGTYFISLVTTNNCGNSDTIKRAVTIDYFASPIVGFTTNTGNLICPNTTVQFTNYSSDTSNCIWSFGHGDTSNYSNPFYTFTYPGNYLVTLTIQNGCGNTGISTLPITVSSSIILPAPSIHCDVSQDSITFSWDFINGAVGYEISWDDGYSWTFVPDSINQTTIMGIQNENHSLLIRALGEDYCYYGSISDTSLCGISNNIKPVHQNELLYWHPNPTKYRTQILCTNAKPIKNCKESIFVKVYDVRGRLLDKLVFKDPNSAIIHVDQYREGIYVFNTLRCGKPYWQKIIITK